VKTETQMALGIAMMVFALVYILAKAAGV